MSCSTSFTPLLKIHCMWMWNLTGCNPPSFPLGKVFCIALLFFIQIRDATGQNYWPILERSQTRYALEMHGCSVVFQSKKDPALLWIIITAIWVEFYCLVCSTILKRYFNLFVFGSVLGAKCKKFLFIYV